MADLTRSLVRAIVVAGAFTAAAACSDSSTKASARSIAGHVTIDPGESRIPAENFVGAHRSAPLANITSRRAKETSRINIVFRSEAIGGGRLGALSVRSVAERVWRKEAANSDFRALRRHENVIRTAPVRIQCSLENDGGGTLDPGCR